LSHYSGEPSWKRADYSNLNRRSDRMLVRGSRLREKPAARSRFLRATGPRQFPLRPYTFSQKGLRRCARKVRFSAAKTENGARGATDQRARSRTAWGIHATTPEVAQPGRDEGFLPRPMKGLAIATPSGRAVFSSDLSSEFGLGGAGSVGDTSRESPRCPLRAMAFCLRGRAASATAPATVATIATPTPITTAGCFLM